MTQLELSSSPATPDNWPATDTLRRAAKAVCAHGAGGFCRDVGGELGCTNGRGAGRNWRNCIATDAQLSLSGHAEQASAALLAAGDGEEGDLREHRQSLRRMIDNRMGTGSAGLARERRTLTVALSALDQLIAARARV